MKTMNNNIASKFALAAFLALGTLAVTSCSKDNNQTGQEVPTGNSQLIVRIAGISEGDNISTKGSKSSTANSASAANSIELVQSDGFDAVVAVDNNVSAVETLPLAQAGLKASNGLRAASTPMVGGTKYRLFLYKKTGSTYTFDQSVDFASGSEAPVAVTKGATYKWVAISYNSVTDLVQDRGTNDTFTLPENKDVLYAASTADFTVGETVAPITISFNRLYARVAIEVNTLGMFAPINSASITVTGQSAKSATVDLTTGALTLAPSAGTPALTEANFVDIDGDASRKVAYYYTADPAAQNLTVQVTNLSIKLDDGVTDRTFGPTALTQTKSITPEPGKSHRFLVGLTESALTFGTGANAVKWSRSNLYYKAGETTPYRFNHDNTYNTAVDQNSYFAFKGHLPRRLASGNAASQKDPCALVYPAGLWKTPTKANLNAVQNQEGVLGSLLGNVGAILGLGATPGAVGTDTYIEFTPTAGVNTAYGTASSGNNKLRFNYNGLQTNVGLVEGLINLNLGTSKGGQVAFWTEDQVLNLPGLAGVGAWSYLGYTGRNLLGGAVPKGSAGAGLLNIDLIGLNLISSALMNVRCVRDATWAAKSELPTYNPMPTL